MRVRRIAVRHLGAIEQCAVELGPGLNVLHGPNDIGKSTLAAAIRMALLLPSTSRAADALAPWAGGGPSKVELVLELGPQRFLRIEKEYAGNRGTAILESSRDGRSFTEEHKGRAVDGELRRMLGWGIAEPGGAGGQRGVPESFLGTVLLGTQDDVDRVLERSLDEDDDATGRDKVAAALQALARDARFVAILGAAQARYDEAWTGTGQVRRGAGGRLKEAAEAVTRSRTVRDEYRRLVEQTAHVQTELAEHTARRDVAQEALRIAREQRERLERDADGVRRHRAASEAVEVARAALLAVQSLDGDVQTARAAVVRLEAEERLAETGRDRRREARDAAATALRDAQSADELATEAADRAALQALKLAAAEDERQLAEAREQVRIAEAADRAQAQLAAARRERADAEVALTARDGDLAAAEEALERWRQHEAVLDAEEAARIRAELTAAEAARDTLAERRRAALARADSLAEASRAAQAELDAAALGDDARQRLALAVAQASQALAEAERRAELAAERRAAAEAVELATKAVEAAEEACDLAAYQADTAKTEADTKRAELDEWDRLEAALLLWDARADLATAQARAAARAEADRGVAERVRERDAVVATRAGLHVPTRAELTAVRRLVGDLEVARSALSVGITVRVEPRGALQVSVRADGAAREATTGPIDVEARSSVVLDLGDLATVTVTGGDREAQARVEALEARHAAEVAPALAAAGVADLAGLEAATDRAEDLDRKRETMDAAIASAGRARDALPAPEPGAADRVDELVRTLGAALVAALDALGDDPRAAWKSGRVPRATAADAATGRAMASATALTLATANQRHAEATRDQRKSVLRGDDVAADPAELPAARDRLAQARRALDAVELGAKERQASLTAACATATAALTAARAEATELDGEHGAALSRCGAVAGRLSEVEARPAAAVTDLDPAFASLGKDRRAGWARVLAERTSARAAADTRRSEASTAAAVAAQRLQRAQEDHAAVPAGLDAAAALADATRAEETLAATRRAVATAEASASARRDGRAKAQADTVAALAAADMACVAADAELRGATETLGQERGRLAVLERSRESADQDGARRRLDEALASLAALGAVAELDPAALVTAQDREAGLRAAAEEAERAVQRQQGALEHVGGAVADERLAEADAAHDQALQRERETHTDYAGWRLLREVLLEAERDQAANLGGALAPLVSTRLHELTGSRYEHVVLAPHLSTEGVLVHGQTRAAASLSVGTREQLSTLVRLCLAERLETMLVLDDQLVQSDDLKLGWFRKALLELAGKVQVLVFTCRPGDYPGAGEGATVTDLGRCIARRA